MVKVVSCLAADLEMESVDDLTKVIDSIQDSGLSGESVNAERDDDNAVFLCSKCKRPLGDTCGWKGSDPEEHCIMLKAVSTYVTVEKEQVLSKQPSEYGCIFENLLCSGCNSIIGKIYRCTPKQFDFKRDLFCLDVDAVDSYIFGSASQQAVPESEEPVLFENRMALEEEIEKAKAVLAVLQCKLASLETSLLHDKG
ncbi:protein Mis18-alpha [Spea bombifrons]|uniref:protein Mis18-alpha n=1 Tax=Spea bombifrons TaxID=233779 RepID=UPI00234AE795|nr:protein Mis18-alpha [Spea bombifrons]